MNFTDWLMEQDLDEGWQDWAKRAAVGGAMLAGGLGMSGQAQSATSPDAAQYVQPQAGNTMSPYSYNSEIGKYTVQKVGNDTIYQTAKGNFKRIPSKLDPTGFRFVKIP